MTTNGTLLPKQQDAAAERGRALHKVQYQPAFVRGQRRRRILKQYLAGLRRRSAPPRGRAAFWSTTASGIWTARKRAGLQRARTTQSSTALRGAFPGPVGRKIPGAGGWRPDVFVQLRRTIRLAGRLRAAIMVSAGTVPRACAQQARRSVRRDGRPVLPRPRGATLPLGNLFAQELGRDPRVAERARACRDGFAAAKTRCIRSAAAAAMRSAFDESVERTVKRLPCVRGGVLRHWIRASSLRR